MQRAKKIILSPAAAAANNIAASQTPSGAGNLTINGSAASGSVATLDMARRVAIIGGSDESGKTFTVYGTNNSGVVISESLAGPNASTVVTTKDYLTVTRVAVSAATSGPITVGTSSGSVTAPSLSSPWVPISQYDISGISFHALVSGTVNYTIEHTMDDPFSMAPVNGNPDVYLNPLPHPVVQGQTISLFDSFGFPVRAVRVTINSYSSTPTLTVNFVVASNA